MWVWVLLRPGLGACREVTASPTWLPCMQGLSPMHKTPTTGVLHGYSFGLRLLNQTLALSSVRLDVYVKAAEAEAILKHLAGSGPEVRDAVEGHEQRI